MLRHSIKRLTVTGPVCVREGKEGKLDRTGTVHNEEQEAVI